MPIYTISPDTPSPNQPDPPSGSEIPVDCPHCGGSLAGQFETAFILIPKFASYRDLVFRKALGTSTSEELAV